jgi:hypothetical protein
MVPCRWRISISASWSAVFSEWPLSVCKVIAPLRNAYALRIISPPTEYQQGDQSNQRIKMMWGPRYHLKRRIAAL